MFSVFYRDFLHAQTGKFPFLGAHERWVELEYLLMLRARHMAVAHQRIPGLFRNSFEENEPGTCHQYDQVIEDH